MLLYLRSDLVNVWFLHWVIGMCHTYNAPCTFAKKKIKKNKCYHINEVTFLCGCYYKGSLKSIYKVFLT